MHLDHADIIDIVSNKKHYAAAEILHLFEIEDGVFRRSSASMRERLSAASIVVSPRTHGARRQYFLKREAAFFVVLVYSGWSASRFPNARSD
jgi:hypothetical protein